LHSDVKQYKLSSKKIETESSATEAVNKDNNGASLAKDRVEQQESHSNKPTDTTQETEKEEPSAQTDHTTFPQSPLQHFWDNHVEPYSDIITDQKVMDVVHNLVTMLNEQGGCSSIASGGGKDIEKQHLYTVKDSLAKVSLLDHSLGVAKAMIDLVKEFYLDYEIHMPKAIISALGHDIGKIPEYRNSDLYGTQEHHIISAHKVNELFSGKDISWVKQVYKTIEGHHSYSNDQFTILLKKADQQTRQLEMMQFTKDVEIKLFHEWFTVKKFFELLEMRLNYDVSTSGTRVAQFNTWGAFTFKGNIYVKPFFMYELIKKVCKMSKALDITVIDKSEKDATVKRAVAVLRKQGFIMDILDRNYSSMKFEMLTVNSKDRNEVLIPMKCPEWFEFDKIDERRQGYLNLIQRVSPVSKRKTV